MRKLSAWFLAVSMAFSLVQIPAYASEVSNTDNNTAVEETEEIAASTEEAVVTTETSTTPEEETDVYTEEESLDLYDIAEETTDTTYYVEMNIPYGEFYASENVSEQVDVVTTATTSKFTSTTGLAKGTYHDDKNILGVTYPVAMDTATYTALADNKLADDADLGTAASYAFKDLATTPVSYKTVTYSDGTYSFGDVTGPEKDASNLGIKDFTTTGGYGNYQISLDGVLTAGTINDEAYTLYGVVFTTSDEKNYPMYMLENIWLGTRVTDVEVAWCVQGAPEIKKAHGSGDAFYQYDMNGATITGIKLITDIGVYNISTDYTLAKFDSNNTLSVNDANTVDGATTYEASFVDGFDPEYSINMDGATVADGQITIPSTTTPGTYTLTATDKNGVYAPVQAKFAVSAYALVNIPYNYFYKADLNNDVDVDVFTSATKSKAAMPNLAGNTYHTEDCSEITGVTYPALITSTTGLTAVESDAISTSASWSYALLSEKPNQYKTITVTTSGRGASATTTYEVGAVTGTVTEYVLSDLTDGAATLSTSTSYGDYQLAITGLFTTTDRSGNVTAEGKISADDYTYGVIISTKEGSSYGLRGLENIWRSSELAWCTGFTTSVHNCPTSSEHYKAMMGQTITSVTYLTTSGIYTVKDLSIYVPVKSSEISVSVADAYVSDGKAVITDSYPSDFSPAYSVNMDDATIENGQIIFPANVKNGSYTLTVKDNNGKYADASATFTVKADQIPAVYDATSKSLVKAANATDEEFSTYIAAISSVTVDGTSYSKNGFRGAAGTVIVKDDGSIDTSLELFATNKVYSLTIPVTGYDDLTFNVDLRKATTITATSSYTKKVTDKAFKLSAKADSGVTLTYTSSNKSIATVSSAGTVTLKGVGTVKITVKAAATDNYLAASKVITIKVVKATQPLKVKVSSKTYKVKTVKKKAQKFSIGASSAQGKVTYKSSSKYVTVTSKGAVTVKKGAKKGTYKITVKAAGNSKYNAGTKTVTIKVK